MTALVLDLADDCFNNLEARASAEGRSLEDWVVDQLARLAGFL